MSGSMTGRVFLGSSGPDVLLTFDVYDHSQKPIANPFSETTYMVLTLVTSLVVVDSRQSPYLIDWSFGNGAVQLSLGSVIVPQGVQVCRLMAYDDGHPFGQVLAHEKGPNFLSLEFV